VRYTPTGTGPGSELNLTIDLPEAPASGAAVVVVKPVGGPATSTLVTADGAVGPVSFGADATQWVEVTLANTSDRFTCWKGTPFSCAGKPLDDKSKLKVKAVVTP